MTQNEHMIEILQLGRSKRTFVSEVMEGVKNETLFIGVQYQKLERKTYAADDLFINIEKLP